MPLRELGAVLKRHRSLMFGTEGGLLLLCLLYCLLAPKQYQARARVELRATPESALSLGTVQTTSSFAGGSAPLAQETAAGVLRGDGLAWQVISTLKLYANPGFRGNFAQRFPGFDAAAPDPAAQAWLLERFGRRLEVRPIPRTVLIEIRFRSRSGALSAAVVNELLRDHAVSQTRAHVQATLQASGELERQLSQLKQRMESEEQRLETFERTHGIVTTSEFLPNGELASTQHGSAGAAVDELNRQLIAARADRILDQAEYDAASHGDPETVLAADPRLQAQGGGISAAALEQLQARQVALEQEQAQLTADDGPNFPRVVEIRRQLDELRGQKGAEDLQLVARFQANLRTAEDRERLVRKGLAAATAEGVHLNGASAQYAAMQQEVNASRQVYLQVLEKMEEAGFAAGTVSSDLAVVDAARIMPKPVSPNLPLDLAITFFVGLWLSLGGAYMAEWRSAGRLRAAVVLLAVAVSGMTLRAQAPTPSTSGLPTGVATFPKTPDTRITPVPNPKEAPPVWGGAAETPGAAQTVPGVPLAMALPIEPGDLLLVTESHTPEFRTETHVSREGTVNLPLVHEVAVKGMEEDAAARAIETTLVAKGMLRHPQVNVLVLAYVGQDVSILGEVQRPGVYSYGYHHRLLDLISAASGLTSRAGRVVNVYHANDPKTPHPVLLDPAGRDAAGDHNPELSPGDTVQVSRAGLVYVVGDVNRPGGFAIDATQKLTMAQALALAWGPSQNAALRKAVLIREQNDGRTVTAVDLKRLLKGKDPDPLVEDRDILYVPDSLGKNMLNRTLESAIQSTIGVTIYSALVYSQRY